MNEVLIPQLLKDARAGNCNFFVQFGGQGGAFLSEMRRLYQKEALQKYFSVCFDALNDFQKRADVKEEASHLYNEGLDLKSWLEDKNVPSDLFLERCTITFPANQIIQLGYLYLLDNNSFPVAELLKYTHSCSGHSQGLQAAVAFSLGQSGDDFLKMVYELVYWFCVAGFYMQRHYGVAPTDPGIVKRSIELDRERPTAMAVVMAIGQNELEEMLEQFNKDSGKDKIEISLYNTSDTFVITGHTADVARFREVNHKKMEEDSITFNYLPVSAPFHREDFTKDGIGAFFVDEVNKKFSYTASDLKIPVISFFDGKNLQNSSELSNELASIMVSKTLFWDKSLQSIWDNPTTHIIDFGPGKISTFLTKAVLKEKNQTSIPVLSAVGRAGLNKIIAPLKS